MSSTDFKFERLNKIDNKIQFTVFGYLRYLQKELIKFHNNDNITIFNNVPSLINYTCLSYYYNPPYFGQISKHYKKTGQFDDIITKTGDGGWNSSAYGFEWIKYDINKIIEWKFLYKRSKDGATGISIGIITNKHHQNTELSYSGYYAYTYNNSGTLLIDKKNNGKAKISSTQGDITSFIL